MPRTCRKRRVLGDHFHHGFLIDSHHGAIGYCACRAHAEGPPCEATFAEESTLIQNAYCGFLPARRYNGEFDFSFLDIEHGVSDIPLNKDPLPLSGSCDCSTSVDGRKEGLEGELAAFLGRCNGCHDWLPFNA